MAEFVYLSIRVPPFTSVTSVVALFRKSLTTEDTDTDGEPTDCETRRSQKSNCTPSLANRACRMPVGVSQLENA